MYWFNHDFPSYEKVDNAMNKYKGFAARCAYCYGWDSIRKTYKELVEREKREYYIKSHDKRTEKGYKFLDKEIDNAPTVQTGSYSLYQLAMIFMGLMPNPGNIKIPDGFTIDHAIKIMLATPSNIRTTNKHVLRTADMSETIKDVKTEHSGAIDLNPRLRKFLNENNVQ